MKYLYAIGLLFVGLVVGAQTAAPSWSGLETQQLLANCALHNADSVVCVATDGVAFSYQGAAFVKVATQGTQGPAGPQGPTGATGAIGPQGPPGPVQSFNTNKCSSWSGGNSGMTETGCVQTTP